MILKFRAWDKTCKKMIYSGFAVRADGNIEGIDYTNTYAAKNFIVMQSTGLKDMNGIEIFEGDIVNALIGGYPVMAEIVFEDCRFMKPIAVPEGSGISTSTYYGFSCDEKNHAMMVVIGNRYENPELLEEG